jgi:hypothetical protein
MIITMVEEEGGEMSLPGGSNARIVDLEVIS